MRSSQLLVVVGEAQRRPQSVKVILTAHASPALADKVAKRVRLGRVNGKHGSRIIVFLDDVVLQLIPVVVDSSHN
jgi:hypothetical protein